MRRHHHHRYEILERFHHRHEQHVRHETDHHGLRPDYRKHLRLHHARWHGVAAHAAVMHQGHRPHHADHTALRLPHVDPNRPVDHPITADTPREVHQAIHQAAETFGVSPNVLGAIAYLESRGGDPNAKDGKSLGLFQMQHETANSVMKRYGDKIADSLEATDKANGADKYNDIIGDLKAHRLPSKEHYAKMVLDPTFNALLGAGNTKLNAGDWHIKPDLAHLTDLYSVHLSGRHIGANDERPLSSIMPPEHIRANAGVLGADKNPDPTAAEAHAHMTEWLKGHLDHFTAKDKALGLYKPDPVEVPKHAAAHHHGGAHRVSHPAAHHHHHP